MLQSLRLYGLFSGNSPVEQVVMKVELHDSAIWIQGAFVVLLAGIAWLLPLGRKRKWNASLLAAIAIGAILLVQFACRRLSPLAGSVLEDWIPVPLMLFPYWQVGQFFTGADPVAEKRLANFDRALFRALGIAPAETLIGAALGMYLELAYVMVYPLIPLGVATLYVANAREFVNYYWIVVLVSTYISLAITPFVRAMPPRVLESYEGFPMPPSKLGALNRFILNRGGIKAITFPSAHVASAMAASLVLLRVAPWAGLIFLLISVSIALATVVGGYHYAADALLASFVAIVVFAATFPTGKAVQQSQSLAGRYVSGNVAAQAACPFVPCASGPGRGQGHEVPATSDCGAHRACPALQPFLRVL